jgi:hypothetical protein
MVGRAMARLTTRWPGSGGDEQGDALHVGVGVHAVISQVFTLAG